MLDNAVLQILRSELGSKTLEGLDDDVTLETIYESTDLGNGSTKMTAWYVWKQRLANLQNRSFDVTTGGSLMSRSQRTRFIQGRIAELEFAIGAETLGRFRGTNDDLQTTYQSDEDSGSAEFS